MTLDAIRNIEFNRGRGYRADEVDDFIDSCVETVEALQRENQTLNQKLKVLADKLVEYRNEEDNIRSALLSAQRTGEIIIREAKEQAERILKDAEDSARREREDCRGAITDEQKELQRVRQEAAAFREQLLSLYKEHLSLINLLPKKEALVEDSAEEDGSSAEETPVAADTVVEPEAVSDQEDTEENDEREMTSVSRFSNLKFGADYDIREDDEEEENDDEDDDEGKQGHNLFRKRR